MEKEPKKKQTRAPRKPRAAATGETPSAAKRTVRRRAEKVRSATSALPETREARPYIYAIGRRKEAIAQVRLFRDGRGTITVNRQPFAAYFPRYDLQETLLAPLRAVGQNDKIDIEAKVSGGGVRGQAGAVQLGIARTLILLDPTFRVSLRHLDFLRRDPRVKERKKYGLKKARRAPQWAKR
ncbi:30S ribosomal protein S9 [Candidatus Uhrbacteria bacterium]|nr:30S ribosomal protein S9 [Candidatus Uhrbacteria bacterium]